MKLRFKKFLSLILTFTLLLSFFNGLSFKYFYLNAYATTDEDTADAVADAASVSYNAGDWAKATIDGCPPNFFHNAVQSYLTDPKNGYGFGKEKHIDYNKLVTNPVTKKETSFGSADIYKQKDLTTFYVWEVKPCSYNNADRAQLALEQLANYTNTSLHEDQKTTYIIGGKDAPLKNTTEFIIYSPLGVKYKISFWSPVKYDGLILYKFKGEDKRDDDDENAAEIKVTATATQTAMATQPATQIVMATQPATQIATQTAMATQTATATQIATQRIAAFKIPVKEIAGVTIILMATLGIINKMPKNVSLTHHAPKLAAAAIAISTFQVCGTVVHAADGDYYEIPDTPENRVAYEEYLAGKDILEVLDLYDEEVDPEAVDEDEIEEIIREKLDLYDEEDDPEAVDEDEIEEMIREKEEEYNEAKKQTPPRDPLIIHFSNKEKIVLTNLDNGVNFDLDNNGFAETTAWIGTEEGFLAYDLNNNIKIDNGGELFGDKFLMSNGKISSNGFEALASLNENDDFVINKDDTAFFKLSVWFDHNHNGKTEKDELKSLEELGIVSIGFVPESDGTIHVDSNVLEAESALVTFSDNTTKKISEFWFPVDTVNTTHEGISTVGNVPNLGYELENDSDGRLTALFDAFRTETNIGKKRYYLKHILYYITGADNIASNSRGSNIDARDLYVIEQFMGTEFEGIDGKNPNSVAAETLKNIYASIEDIYYNYANFLTKFSFFRLYTYVKSNESGEKYIKYDKVNEIFDAGIENGFDVDVTMYDYGKYLIYLDEKHGTNAFAEFKNKYSSVSDRYAEVLALINNTRTIIGSENSEELYGTSYSDIIFGEGGNDKITGNSGNDLIYSSIGNEIMNGGSGNDYYYFGMFHSNDIINDTEGDNKIIFIDGLSVDDYDTSVLFNGSFVLTNKYTGDTITLTNFISYPFNYEFLSYNEVQTVGGGDPREIIEGTDADDYLDASDGFNIFYGGEGKDIIAGGDNIDFMYGGNGNDQLLGRNGTNIIYGEDGNDKISDGDHSSYLNGGNDDDEIYGGGGADILDGGAGNDILQGDHGNDTFIYGIGYDIDTLKDAAGEPNTIIIHGYRKSDMNNFRDGSNLIIDFDKDTGDRMIIERFFDYATNSDITFVFDDGTSLSRFDIRAKSMPIYGDENNNYINGTNEADIIDGGAGDDTLCGFDGEDTYFFGRNYGHDIINEWGSDHSFVEFKDINSDEISITGSMYTPIIITVNDTEDTLTFATSFWASATYTLIFADGAEGYVDKNTYEFIFTKQPDPVDEENITDSDISEAEDVSDEETAVAA